MFVHLYIFFNFLFSILFNCDHFHSVSDFDQQKPTKRKMLKMESVLFMPPAAGPSLCCVLFIYLFIFGGGGGNFLILDSEESLHSSFTPSFVCFLDSGSCSLVPPSYWRLSDSYVVSVIQLMLIFISVLFFFCFYFSEETKKKKFISSLFYLYSASSQQ